MMKKQKGERGYLDYKTMIEALKTAAMFVMSVGCFLFGYLKFDTIKTIFTVVAILGLLPASKLLTTLILYLVRKKFHDDIYLAIKDSCAEKYPYYEMVMTSEKKNFYLNCVVVIDHSIYAISEYKNFEEEALKKYLKPILVQNGFKSEPTVKVFDKPAQFIARMKELEGVTVSESDLQLRDLLSCLSL